MKLSPHPVLWYTRTKGEKAHDVAKPATRKLCRNLRDGGRPANRRHATDRPEKRQVRTKKEHVDLLRASRREIGYELGPVLSVVREARLRRGIGVPIPSTAVSRAEQQRNATCT